MKKRILVAGILLIGLGGLASVQLFHRPSSQPPQALQTSFQYETPSLCNLLSCRTKTVINSIMTS